jgi:kinesin family protein 1
MVNIGQNVRVAVRVRPFNQREIERSSKCCVAMDGNRTTITDPETGKVRDFSFDFSYWSHAASDDHFADQTTVFENLGKDCIESAWLGYNVSLFAYGQTGSGKSFSMVGHAGDPGIVPRVCKAVFEKIDANTDADLTFKVETSMLEIYNEKVKDLFNMRSVPPEGLKVREHPKRGPYVDGLSNLLVGSQTEIDTLMEGGTQARTIAATKMNNTSSRAHTIFQIIFTQTRVDRAAGKATDRVSRINLVDLAGSERANSTGNTGDRLKEGININRSLSALGNCINALAERAKASGGSKRSKAAAEAAAKHVPYRDSVLTWLLKDSLGGNARTVMVAALSPADINFSETLSTLRYARRAKNIQNVAVVNEDPNEKLVTTLRNEVEELRAQLAASQGAGGVRVVKDEQAEQQRRELEEELAASQRLIEEMQMSWAEKERQTKAIAEERQQKLVALGVVVDESMKDRPQLVNLNQDATMSGCLVYFLKEGVTTVGKSAPSELQLHGLGIAEEHCRIECASLNGAAPVTMVLPGGAGKTFVNGLLLEAPAQLAHGSRVIFGSGNFFRYHDPAEVARAREQRAEAVAEGEGPSPAIDWEFAQAERLQVAMAESNEKTDTVKAALEAAKTELAGQERRLAAEQEDASAKLAAQQADFAEKVAALEGGGSALQAQLQDAESRMAAQQDVFDRIMQAKEAELSAKRAALRVSEAAERRQALLEDELVRVIPLVEEANLMSTELRRDTLFEVKVVSKLNQAVRLTDGAAAEPEAAVQVKVSYVKLERDCMWEQEKLTNRIYLMREFYASAQGDPGFLATVAPAGEAPSTPVLIK